MPLPRCSSLFGHNKIIKLNIHEEVFKSKSRIPRSIRNYKISHETRELPRLFYLIPVLTTCLGVWQVKRHFWKQELKRQAAEDIMKIEELTLPPLEDCKKFYNKRYRLKGKFLHNKEFLVGPCNGYYCQHPCRGIKCKDGTTANRTFHIYTPFVIADTGKTIIVDRGYIAEKCRFSPALRQETIKEEEMEEVTGFLVNMWKFYDVFDINMWETVDYDVHMIRADTTQSFEDGPYGQGMKKEVYDMHLPYAFFWFFITVLFFGIFKRTSSGKFKL